MDTIEIEQMRLASAVEESVNSSVPLAPENHRLHEYRQMTGLMFYGVDSMTGRVLHATNNGAPSKVSISLLRHLQPCKPDVVEFESGLIIYSLPLPTQGGRSCVAVGFALARSECRPMELTLTAAEEDWPQEQFDIWMEMLPQASALMLRNLLTLTVAHLEELTERELLHAEIEGLGDQIEQTYEEISLLHSLTRHLQISRSPKELAEVCLSRMHGLIRAEANLIWIEDHQSGPSMLVEGRLPFDELGMAHLIARFSDHDWSRPLVKNHIQNALLGAEYPGLDSVVIVPIAEGSHRSGWIISCNRSDGNEFGTVEASLLSSIATILGTHIRNIDLYNEHEQLLLCFVRSLVSTLDAKDPYTRGHSERVALIARRLGEELGLPEEDLRDIYLSGLLHDIGKIGVDDRILRKPGQLTDDEFRKIQEHPMIGYNILQELKNLKSVLPGVRSHHESYNGTGYPDQLEGDDIPLMARILAVADSFDAMGSDRPYRKGMPVEKIEEIFRRGSGQQWDARIVDAYFDVRDEIFQLCSDYDLNGSEFLKQDGAAVIESLVGESLE